MSTPNQNQQLDLVDDQEEGDAITSILEFLTLIGENKILIAKITASFAVIAVVVSLLLTPIFTAKTLFVVPTPIQGGSAAQLMGNLGGIMGGGGAASLLGAGKSPDEMYLEFLKTKLIKDELIKKYDLQKRYEKKSLEATEKELKNRTKLTSLKKAGLISVEVDDQDPSFAADLANAYVTQLKVLMESMALSESSQRKEYYKRELIRAKQELDGVTDYRDMKVRESVLAVIINQLEVATLDSARESLIQVAEIAVAPEKRSFPKRSLIVLVSILAGFFVALAFVWLRTALEMATENPENRTYWNAFRNAWRWRGSESNQNS